jgi:hypothetical protein
MVSHFTRRQLIRAARYAAYGAATLAVLVVAAALLVPLFLDAPAVERELKAKLSQLVQGDVAWEKLSIRLLPSPRGSLTKVRAEIPGAASVSARQVDAHLRLWPLLHGRAEIAAVSLEKPAVRLRIAPSAGAGQRKKEETAANPVEGYRSVVSTIRELVPEALLEVEDGEVEIEFEGLLVHVRDLQLRVDARAEGRTRLEADFDVRAGEVEIVHGNERVRIQRVAMGGKAIAGDDGIEMRVAGAQLGASRLSGASLRYGLEEQAVATSADFDLDLAQGLDATRRLVPDEAAKALSPFHPVSGRAQGRVRFEMPGSAWSVTVDIARSDSSIGIEGLPGPVKLAGVRVGVTRDSVNIERADVSVLDGRALASATISYGKALRVEGAVSEGSVGEQILAWAWKTAGVPQNVTLGTPIRVAVPRASWGPGQPLDLAASASFDSGASVGVELGWTPKALDIRRASLKDAKSDAVLALHLEQGLLEGRFSGALQSASVGAMLKGASVPEGGVGGDLRFRVDLKRPERFSATGKLTGESVDLAWLIGRPVTVERVALQADGEKLRIRQATVSWAKQQFNLSGEVARAADGAPIVDAQIESPGVLVDALLPRADAKPAAPELKRDPKAKAAEDGLLWTRWPLPVRGRIAVRTKFVQYGERKAEPVVATLTLEEQRASLELQQVKLCGISFPLTAEARPEGLLSFSVQLTAQKQQLEQTARCLTERGVQMTGEFDLSAQLRSRGRRSELVDNLEGKVEAESREGRVRQFPLILKILSVRDVAESLKKDGVRLEEAGFPYRSITAKGRFDQGKFVIDESAFRSGSVGFAASGSISLSDKDPTPYDSQLTVLVAPLSGLDSLVRALPVVGYVLGGTLTSWPVRVSGDIRNPEVAAISPEAITSEFVGMFQRTLKLPARLLPKLTPSKPQ